MSFGEIMTIVGTVISGLVALYWTIFIAKKNLKKDEDATEDRVIKLLKEQVDALEKKTCNQDSKIESLEKRTLELEAQNEILKEVLQGRDESSKEYRTKVRRAIDIAEEANNRTIAIDKNIERLCVAIEKSNKK